MWFRTSSLMTETWCQSASTLLTLATITVELYSSYCHSVAVMTSRLNPLSSCNQKNVTWSGPPIVGTSNIIWICVSDQLQLIRFYVALCRYRITFLAVFQWSISRLIKYLPSFSTAYALFGRVQTWVYIRLSIVDDMECLSFSLSVDHSWDIRVDLIYLP